MWGELVRSGGSEDLPVSKLGVYFGTTHEVDEEVYCGRMQPSAQELLNEASLTIQSRRRCSL